MSNTEPSNSKGGGWLSIKKPWYKRWMWWRKHSYSVIYKETGLVAGQRLRLSRTTPFVSGTYKIITKVNGDNSLEIMGDDGKKETISLS